MNITENLIKVRSQMELFGVDAYIVPTEDPHCSEYPANHWKFREYLSGFNGSAGTLVITRDHVGLWTDSRYFLQAEKQLRGTDIELFRQGQENVPDYISYLTYVLPSGSVVGVDGQTLSKVNYDKMTAAFSKFRISINFKVNIIDELFAGREPLPLDEVTEIPLSYAGLTRDEKLRLVQDEMTRLNVTHYMVSALDDVAWMLNMRGSDVYYNPVFYAYLMISAEGLHLYIDPHKLPKAVGCKLQEEGVKVSLYDHFEPNLSNMTPGSRIYYDPAVANIRNVSALPTCVATVEGPDIVRRMKSRKNNTEIEGMRVAHLYDGVAMVNFLHWLDTNIGRQSITELSAAAQLLEFRKQQRGFVSESFATISAYGPNASIVHYTPTLESNATLAPRGLYLLDSGGQYLFGTTDITRTICLGEITDRERTDYTLVLKGHIALASAVFPVGTRGVQLDILARMPMWQHLRDYGHGTGHGVGCYLNVHEGPQCIRKEDNGVAIEAGMITSLEPGFYSDNHYGIRTENLLLCQPDRDVPSFLRFETITLCPIDTRPLDVNLLTDSEIGWLNAYHRLVYTSLEGSLTDEVRQWLAKATAPIGRAD